MNKFILALFLLMLTACGTTGPTNDGGVVTPTPNVTNDNTTGGTCLHKYDSERNFVYVGQIHSFRQKLFGQDVWVFEHTKPNGRKVYLSENEIINYRCERHQRINTSIH